MAIMTHFYCEKMEQSNVFQVYAIFFAENDYFNIGPRFCTIFGWSWQHFKIDYDLQKTLQFFPRKFSFKWNSLKCVGTNKDQIPFLKDIVYVCTYVEQCGVELCRNNKGPKRILHFVGQHPDRLATPSSS
jgi:hypothetical protein